MLPTPARNQEWRGAGGWRGDKDLAELWDPVPDVVAIEVIVLGLLRDIEVVDTPTSEACSCHPVAPV